MAELTEDTFGDWVDETFGSASKLLDELWELDQDLYWDVYYTLKEER